MKLTTQPTTNPEQALPWECRGQINLGAANGTVMLHVAGYGSSPREARAAAVEQIRKLARAVKLDKKI